jgi:hypothetical protein
MGGPGSGRKKGSGSSNKIKIGKTILIKGSNKVSFSGKMPKARDTMIKANKRTKGKIITNQKGGGTFFAKSGNPAAKAPARTRQLIRR